MLEHMRSAVVSFTIGLTAACFPAGHAPAAEYALVVPRDVPQPVAAKLHSIVTVLVGERLQPGDVLRIIDATAVQPIATFEIPEGSKARVTNLRLRELEVPLNAWSRFVRRHYVERRGDTAGHGRILLPQTLTHLGTQSYAGVDVGSREICTLVVGSMLYDDPRDEAFSMIDGLFPSDGLIAASQSESVFGTADRQGHLSGMNFHVFTLDGPDAYGSDAHELRVHRTWHLHIAAQSGVMATYTRSLHEAVARFLNCEQKSGRSFSWDGTRQTEEMISAESFASLAVEPEVSREIASEGQGAEPWLTPRTVTVSERAPELRTTALKIGVRWGDDDQCGGSDLDLYVRSSPERPYLYFRNKASLDGTYHKDYQSAPGTRNGLEFVDITDQVPLAELEIWINYYGGSCPGGPKGVVRAFVNGDSYETDFHIPSSNGNRGLARERKDKPHWVKIEPAMLFNLM